MEASSSVNWRMKYLLFITLLICSCLVSCGSRAKTVTGQVFVTSVDGTTLRLSGTEIHAISRDTAEGLIKRMIQLRAQTSAREEQKLAENKRSLQGEKDKRQNPMITSHLKEAAAYFARGATDAQTEVADYAKHLARYSTPEFTGEFPTKGKTTSDADGRFSISVPDEDIIFAHAERDIGNRSRFYCWLLKVPRDSQTVMLTNTNTIERSAPDNFAAAYIDVQAESKLR